MLCFQSGSLTSYLCNNYNNFLSVADTASAEKLTPQDTITEESVKKVLAADKGNDVHLKSWKVVDFTKKGDNYACVVTSVEVKYSGENEEEHSVTYVVKLNAQVSFAGMPDFSPVLFQKEGRFYQEIAPAVNQVLISAGQEPLHVPKCFLVVLDAKKEQIYFEDLRGKGYQMSDRRKGMDEAHASLVLHELARLHSASYIMMDQFSKEPATSRFDFLAMELLDFSIEGGAIMKGIFESSFDNSKMMLEKVEGYEKAITWLEQLKHDLDSVVPAGLKSERFNSINHGDCWNNNILFR